MRSARVTTNFNPPSNHWKNHTVPSPRRIGSRAVSHTSRGKCLANACQILVASPPDSVLKKPSALLFPVVTGRHFDASPEDRGEVLAGVETALQGDLGDRSVWFFTKLVCGVPEAALDEVVDASGVHKGPAVVAECCYSHSAMGRHLWQGPRLAGTCGVHCQIPQEEVHRVLRGLGEGCFGK
jgi:hypothetical protein